MWDEKRRVLKMTSLKQGIIQDKLVNGEKIHGYTIPNDAIGFNRLLGDLKTVHQPEIVFKATGLYSRRLQAFFEDKSYAYTRLSSFSIASQAMSKKRFIKNYATSAVSIRIVSALKTVCTRFYRSLFLNWKTQLGNNIGTWSWLFHVIVLYWSWMTPH